MKVGGNKNTKEENHLNTNKEKHKQRKTQRTQLNS